MKPVKRFTHQQMKDIRSEFEASTRKAFKEFDEARKRIG
jgi:hypothetical protein